LQVDNEDGEGRRFKSPVKMKERRRRKEVASGDYGRGIILDRAKERIVRVGLGRWDPQGLLLNFFFK